MPNRSKGRGQTKCDLPGPPGWGLGWGLITHYRKNKFIAETEDTQTAINIGETTRAHRRKETQRPTASIVNPKLETMIGYVTRVLHTARINNVESIMSNK